MRSALPTFGLAAALAAGFCLAAPPPAAAQVRAPSTEEKKAFGEAVREYLLANPEVVQDAIAELDKRRTEADRIAAATALRDVAEPVFAAKEAIVVGNPAGDVRLVEFFDYNCPYCKRAMEALDTVMRDDKRLKVVLVDFPVLGPESVEASRLALAARAQLKGERYWEFHRRLMGSKGRIGRDRALALAKEMGLDAARLEKDAAAPAVTAGIDAAVKVGDALKLQGTPAFVVGDEVLFGAVGPEKLTELVASVRRCGKASC